MSDTIFVTGASGKLGSAVVKHLLTSQGVAPARIVAGSRDPAKLTDLAAKGVKTVEADFDDAVGLEQAFSGAGTVLIVSTDALDGAGTRLRQHKAAVSAAAKAGVGRIAYTSLPSPETSKVSFAPDHLGTEEAIKATGLPYLIFRNNWYQENLLMALPNAFASGQWFTAAGSGKIAYIARDDIAAAIAAGLARPASGNTIYTLTGDTALTHDEVARLASSIVGKPLQVVHVTDEQLAGGMKAAGIPEAWIPTFVSFDTATRAGDLAAITDDVATLSGRKLSPLAAFLEANKTAF
jgi:NAD(P)H dehydrogenase (quinone)